MPGVGRGVDRLHLIGRVGRAPDSAGRRSPCESRRRLEPAARTRSARRATTRRGARSGDLAASPDGPAGLWRAEGRTSALALALALTLHEPLLPARRGSIPSRLILAMSWSILASSES